MSIEIKTPSPALKFTQAPKRRVQTKRIIVHHYHSETAAPQTVHLWHLNNGWSGFGYNFAVDMDGTIWEGRGLDAVGSHTGGNNSDSIGIACQGRYDDHTTKMPDAQFNSLVRLIKHVQSIYGKIPVLRHGDVTATACPGRYFPWGELLKLEERGDKGVASPKERSVRLDILGEIQSIGGYIEDGATWVRLTEIGAALGFGVFWDSERRVPVVAAGEKPSRHQQGSGIYPQPQTVAIDILGSVQNITGYIEDGATWVRLTEIARALGFVATWDNERRIGVVSEV